MDKEGLIGKAIILGLVLWMSSGTGTAQTPEPVKETATAGKMVTLADDGTTITLRANETFLLKLGEGYDWNITIDDQTVISRIVNVLVVRGAQGLYEARKVGNATLTAAGDPICRRETPPCSAPSRMFTVHFIVTSAGTPSPFTTPEVFIPYSVSSAFSKITVEATQPALLGLKMFNPSANKVNLDVQVILNVSSGLSVTESARANFTKTSTNQYTGLFSVRPGETNNVLVQITSQELGSKPVEVLILYYPESNKSAVQKQFQQETIIVKEISVTQTPASSETSSSSRLPGFEAIIAALALLAVAGCSLRRKKKE